MSSQWDKIVCFRFRTGVNLLHSSAGVCRHSLLMEQELRLAQKAGKNLWRQTCPLQSSETCPSCTLLQENVPCLSISEFQVGQFLLRMVPEGTHLTYGHPAVVAFQGIPDQAVAFPFSGWIGHAQVQALVDMFSGQNLPSEHPIDLSCFPEAYQQTEIPSKVLKTAQQWRDPYSAFFERHFAVWLGFFEAAAQQQEDIFLCRINDKHTPAVPNLLEH